MPGLPFPDIDPIAIQIGPLAIRWYALAYIAGIVLGWWYVKRLARRWRSPIGADHLDDFVLWATLGIVLGGRIGYVLFYNPGYYLAEPLQTFAVWRGGMSFHGGLLGMLAATWLFARRRGLPVLTLADLIACAAPVGLFFGRIANFINGELYGRVTDVPWAMVFPGGGPAARHPSQLYEAFLEGAALFILLTLLARRPAIFRRPGLLSGIFLVGYGVARFGVEFARAPDAHLGLLLGPFSMGQMLSLPLILLGIYLIVQARAPSKPTNTSDGDPEIAGNRGS